MTGQQYRVIADRDRGDDPTFTDAQPGDRLTYTMPRSGPWVTHILDRIERPVSTTDEPCGRRAWPHEEYQGEDNACICLLPQGHEGMHQCGAGCGVDFAGGLPVEPQVDVCLNCRGAGYLDGGDMRDDEPCHACDGTGQEHPAPQPPTREQIAEVVESMRSTMAFDSRDWGATRRDAWLYGIVLGWDGPDDAMGEVAARYGWSEATVERLQRLHSTLALLQKGGERGAVSGECGAVHPRYEARCTQPAGHEGPHVDIDFFIQWEADHA